MKTNLFFYFVIGAGFLSAALLALVGDFQRIPGAILVVVGVVAALFSRKLASTPSQLTDGEYIPGTSNWLRPLTLLLWGSGLTIVGVFWLLSGT